MLPFETRRSNDSVTKEPISPWLANDEATVQMSVGLPAALTAMAVSQQQGFLQIALPAPTTTTDT